MKRTQYLQILILSSFLLFGFEDDFNKLELGNSLYSKTFFYSISDPGPIQVEYVEKHSGEVLSEKDVPVFEFVIAGRITNSMDKLWIFDSQNTV